MAFGRRRKSKTGGGVGTNQWGVIGTSKQDAAQASGTNPADVQRGRSAGSALRNFNKDEGWTPFPGTTETVAILMLRSDKREAANLHKVQGAADTLTIEGDSINVPGLRKVVGALPLQSSRGSIEVMYVGDDNRTYSEMFHKENGTYVKSWEDDENGKPSRRHQHRRPIVDFVPIFQKGRNFHSKDSSAYMGVDDEGSLSFGALDGPGLEIKNAFERDLKHRGRVISATATDDGVVLLQETSDGQKTLSSLRSWNRSSDENRPSYNSVVSSVPVDPSVMEVGFRASEDKSLHPELFIIRGGDKVTRANIEDITTEAKRHKHTQLPVEKVSASGTFAPLSFDGSPQRSF